MVNGFNLFSRLLILLLLTGLAGRVYSVDTAVKSLAGLASLSVVDLSDPDLPVEYAFSDGTEAGPERRLRLRFQAEEKVEVLVAFLSKDMELDFYRDRDPQLFSAESHEEEPAPSIVEWSWEEEQDPFDLYVLFFDPQDPNLEEIRRIVVLSEEHRNARSRRRQLAVSLKGKLNQIQAERSRLIASEGPVVARIGGCA